MCSPCCRARWPRRALVERLRLADAAVIMKVGRNLAKVRRAVEAAGLPARAVYVERGTMEDERILPLRRLRRGAAPISPWC